MVDFCASHDVVRQRVASLRLTGRTPTGLAWACVASILRAKNSQASDSEGGAAQKAPAQPDVRPASEYWTPEAIAARKRLRSEEAYCDAAYRWWSWIRERTKAPSEPAPAQQAIIPALPWMPVMAAPTAPAVKPTPSIDKAQYKAVGVMLQQLLLRAMGLPEIAVSAASDKFDWDGAWAADLKTGYASSVDVQWGLPRGADTSVFDDHCFLTAVFGVMELVCAHEHPFKYSRLLCQLLAQAQSEQLLQEAAITHARNIHEPALSPHKSPSPIPASPKGRTPALTRAASNLSAAQAAAAGVRWGPGLEGPAPGALTLSFKPRKQQSMKRAVSMKAPFAAVQGSLDSHPLSVLGSRSMKGGPAGQGPYQPAGLLFGPPSAAPGSTSGVGVPLQGAPAGGKAGLMGGILGQRAPLTTSRSMKWSQGSVSHGEGSQGDVGKPGSAAGGPRAARGSGDGAQQPATAAGAAGKPAANGVHLPSIVKKPIAKAGTAAPIKPHPPAAAAPAAGRGRGARPAPARPAPAVRGRK